MIASSGPQIAPFGRVLANGVVQVLCGSVSRERLIRVMSGKREGYGFSRYWRIVLRLCVILNMPGKHCVMMPRPAVTTARDVVTALAAPNGATTPVAWKRVTSDSRTGVTFCYEE